MPTFDSIYAYLGEIGSAIYIEIGKMGTCLIDSLNNIFKVITG